MVAFLLGIVKVAGRFVVEFARSLIIDTVVGAMLNANAPQEIKLGGRNIVCL